MPTISVTPGDIGQKTDKNNLLTYSITTDGEMSTITEKINGTVVNTRTATSGQAVKLGLTQEQWDAIRFGRYADATGGKNTLTVEMGSDKWTYTFDKRLATDADILSAVKATQDSNEVYLPAVKKQLADAINAKGGSVSADADWLTMIGGLNGVTVGKKWASGTVSITTSNKDIVVSGLTFTPSVVMFYANAMNTSGGTKGSFYGMITSKYNSLVNNNNLLYGSYGVSRNNGNDVSGGTFEFNGGGNISTKLYNGGFSETMPLNPYYSSDTIYWYAYE